MQNDERTIKFTCLALRRMQRRAISQEMIDMSILCGREVYVGQKILYVIGRNEIAAWRRQGVRIDHLDGIHVMCALDGVVLNAYRNHDLVGFRYFKHAA
jgi:hypothetical protein